MKRKSEREPREEDKQEVIYFNTLEPQPPAEIGVDILTTVTDDGEWLPLPPIGDVVRAALVRLADLVHVAGVVQATYIVAIGLSHIAAALDLITRERFAKPMPPELLAKNLLRVAFTFVPDADALQSGDKLPAHTDWSDGVIKTFVEEDLVSQGPSQPPTTSRRGVRATLPLTKVIFPSGTEHFRFSADIPTSLPARTTALPDTVHFKNDNINRAAIQAFAVAPTWKPLGGFAYGTTHKFKGLQIALGLPESDLTERIWSSLSKGGARMVKAHYALWARWYEEGGGAGDYVSVNINQFCADIGYAKHHKGGFRREHKQEAMNLLEALTTVQISAEYKAPGASETKRLRGGLWARGMIGEQSETGADGKPAFWEAVAFSFAPGPWFTHPSWARHNNFIGKISAGLLKLDNREEWAILIGGYLGTLMRTNAYETLRVRVSTVLERTGLAQSDDLRRRSGQMLSRFESAMDQLVAVNVITSWTWPEINAEEAEDLDDPDCILEYYAEENLPSADWRRRIVEITLPFDKDRQRLTVQREKAVVRRRVKRKSEGQLGDT